MYSFICSCDIFIVLHWVDFPIPISQFTRGIIYFELFLDYIFFTIIKFLCDTLFGGAGHSHYIVMYNYKKINILF